MIHAYLIQISAYISLHPNIGLLLAFIVALAESLPILGTIVPGSLTMTAIGILVGQRLLPLTGTVAVAVIGALMGDLIGYALGKHYQERIESTWPFKRYPKMLAMGRAFFAKHGGKSIIFGRFIGPTRSSVPLVAGLLKMTWPRFTVAVIPSAILWAILYLLPGVLIGFASLALPKGQATTFTLIGLGSIVVLWLIFWAIQRFFIYIAILINRMTDRCWSWLSRHHGTRLITRMLTNQQQPNDHHQLTLLIFAVFLLMLFLGIFVSVFLHRGLYCINAPVFHFLQTLRIPSLNYFFSAITELGNKSVMASISLLVTLYLLMRRQWRMASYVMVMYAISFCCIGIFKHIYYCPRPSGFIVTDMSSSFPSGHTLFTTSVIGFLAFLSARCLPKRWQWVPYSMWGVLILLVAISRILLGAHWFCDVVAGTLLGLSILLLTIIGYRRKLPMIAQPTLMLAIIFFSIVTPWGLAAQHHLYHTVYRYTPYFPQKTIDMQMWWDQNGEGYLPAYRLDRLGIATQPFNVQWAGNLNQIERILQQHHWQSIASTRDLKRMIARFSSKEPEQHIAFLDQLYYGKPPVLLMMKRIENQPTIIELRLWQTKIYFKNQPTTLLLGSVNYHMAPQSLMSLKWYKQITLKHGGGIDELSRSLGEQFTFKKTLFKDTVLPRKIQYFDWDRTILLIQPK